MIEQDRLEHFLKYAPFLFGRYWKTNMARYFKKYPNTISNWVNGYTEIPMEVIHFLQICDEAKLFYDRKTNTMRKKKYGKSIK